MAYSADVTVTQLLLHWGDGDEQALGRLLPLVYEQLKQLAHARLAGERADHTLNTTALVHEAYLKLVDINQVQWKDRTHFLAMASRQMRRILVDYARERKAAKRGGVQYKVKLDEERLLPEAQIEIVLELDDTLKRLEELNPRRSQAVEHRYFGGMTVEETAAALGVSRATAERDLKFARAWLARDLGRDPGI